MNTLETYLAQNCDSLRRLRMTEFRLQRVRLDDTGLREALLEDG